MNHIIQKFITFEFTRVLGNNSFIIINIYVKIY